MFRGRKLAYADFLPIIIITLILYKLIDSSQLLSRGAFYFISLFSSFVWALAIAYFLNPLMKRVDQLTRRRWLSLIVVYVLVLGVVVLLLVAVLPNVARSIADLVERMPEYFEQTQNWLSERLQSSQFFNRYDIQEYVSEFLMVLVNKTTQYLNLLLNVILGQVIQVTSTVVKFVIGLIISVYLLKDKERFINSTRRFVYALFTNEQDAKYLINLASEINEIFSCYIIGKSIDSLIIGIICYFGLIVFGIPYPLLISLIVGVTNMIPYFGPFIGAIPSILITLFSSPIKALWVALFILALQQFDGWYLGPKILGDRLKLHPVWIILAIILGGQLYGAIGMFVGVPIMAVIKTLIQRYIDRRLNGRETAAL